jgi:hypothetical protein
MASTPGKSWILTGSLENFRINAERGFNPIGFKAEHRQLAFQGQLRTIGESDARLLRERLSAAVPSRA